MENKDIYIPEISCITEGEENGEYEETAAAEKLSDVSVMQALVCLAAAAGLAVALHYAPDAGNRLISAVRELSAAPDERLTEALHLLLGRFGS